VTRTVRVKTTAGQFLEAQIVPMDEGHLHDVETFWQPILTAAGQPDPVWKWDYKLRQSQQQDSYEVYSLDVDNLSQGLLFIETQRYRSQQPQRLPLVYVEMIVTAPWNRIDIEQPPWLKGVGGLLLLFSRQRSVELGYGGRVALHSLPTAEGFYHVQGMPDYGPDPEKDGLVYFEYSAFPM
jgi:hypothetical protein